MWYRQHFHKYRAFLSLSLIFLLSLSRYEFAFSVFSELSRLKIPISMLPVILLVVTKETRFLFV
jgi:hypothetical protein